ncbi:YigZ family protein [uncultured Treponema sp.]|uniref:YigZ family protein n=1 Tax=uncultured Treponema sp. TaxID=162155 RepID=UPI002588D71F|nr:YigZ family protein [uncultured Treponema sp.]
MKVLLEESKAEIVIKNSRFISEVFPVETQAQAREKLHEVKQKYFDATHVVHAFSVGLKSETFGMSDDGEPSGTAGRPVLDVLKGSGITNILLTVTRYFGGTLLGTGGLVHAYSESAKKVLSICKAEPYVEKSSFSFSCSYDLYQTVKHLFEGFNISNLTENFGTDISVKGEIFLSEKNTFLEQIKNISKGTVKCI